MSIAPPSDIILDVAQAGDPLKVQAATSKLAGLAAGSPVSFGDALASAAAPRTALPGPLSLPSFRIGPASSVGDRPAETKQATTDRKFEAMVLQNFIENILPKDPQLFGNAESADMCRTLLAEQLANQLAKSTKLGIAASLQKFQDRVAQQQAATQPMDLKAPRA